jgi:hypothetical protein
MNKLSRARKSQVVRPAGVIAVALVAAAAVGAGQASAALSTWATKASATHRTSQSGDATLQSGFLTVDGTNADDKITLRLQAANVQVDFGDDGTPDFSFSAADVTAIEVNGGNGDDTVRVDETTGVFTIPTTIDGGNGNDNLTGGSRITVTGSGASVSVTGLPATIDLLHPDATDQLNIETGAGDDKVDSGGLGAGVIQLSVTP